MQLNHSKVTTLEPHNSMQNSFKEANKQRKKISQLKCTESKQNRLLHKLKHTLRDRHNAENKWGHSSHSDISSLSDGVKEAQKKSCINSLNSGHRHKYMKLRLTQFVKEGYIWDSWDSTPLVQSKRSESGKQNSCC